MNYIRTSRAKSNDSIGGGRRSSFQARERAGLFNHSPEETWVVSLGSLVVKHGLAMLHDRLAESGFQLPVQAHFFAVSSNSTCSIQEDRTNSLA